MGPLAVALYLATVLAGCVVVSVADSFAPAEIEARLRISGAAAVFTQVRLQRCAVEELGALGSARAVQGYFVLVYRIYRSTRVCFSLNVPAYLAVALR